MKAIVKKDLWEEPHLDASRCMGPGYIWLRFGHPRDENLHMVGSAACMAAAACAT